jgi:hypothetical protein
MRCVICRQLTKDHSIAQARECLVALELIESQKFCRLGPAEAKR